MMLPFIAIILSFCAFLCWPRKSWNYSRCALVISLWFLLLIFLYTFGYVSIIFPYLAFLNLLFWSPFWFASNLWNFNLLYPLTCNFDRLIYNFKYSWSSLLSSKAFILTSEMRISVENQLWTSLFSHYEVLMIC